MPVHQPVDSHEHAPPPPRPASIAVIDVETTGFSPRHGDRIVELAIVVIHAHGPVLREFVTLLNPERDIGPTHIHGLTASDLRHAPRFADVAGLVTETLAGCTAIAGHNIAFDHRFLKAEFERLGHPFPAIPTLCTMRLAGGGKLAMVCEEYDIPFAGQAHTALDDGRATATLLSRLLADAPLQVADLLRLPPVTWPAIARTQAAPICRSTARQRATEAPAYLQRLISRVVPDAIADPDDTALFQYAALLARVLEDRQVTEAEGHALVDLAQEWAIGPARIRDVHRDYLDKLAIAALADGVITSAERRDLCAVAQLLGLSANDLDIAIAAAGIRRAQQSAPPPPVVPLSRDSLAGKRVCFTGANECTWNGQPITRTLALQLAAENGLQVAESVTKKLDILVVADPHTQSGKAKRAREYGIRIVQERVFWQTLGLEVG